MKKLDFLSKQEWITAAALLAVSLFLWISKVDVAINHYVMETFQGGWQTLFGYLSRMGQGITQVIICLVVASLYSVLNTPNGYKELWKTPFLFFFASIHFLFRMFAGENWSNKLVKNKAIGWLVWLPHVGAHALKKAPRESRVWVSAIPIFLVVGLLNFFFKTFFGRPRPKMQWHDLYAPEWFSLSSKMHSFPSGHTITLFCLMTTVLILYKGTKMRALLIFLAVAGALARVGIGSHWPADVVAGAVVGYIGARFFVKRYNLGS